MQGWWAGEIAEGGGQRSSGAEDAGVRGVLPSYLGTSDAASEGPALLRRKQPGAGRARRILGRDREFVV